MCGSHWHRAGASLEVPVGDADFRGRLRLPLLERACVWRRGGDWDEHGAGENRGREDVN